MSLFVKCMLLTVVSTLILAALLTEANNLMQERQIVHGLQNLGRNMTVEVASTSGGSIRFANTGPLTDRMEAVLTRTLERATYGVAFGKEGEMIAEVGTVSDSDRKTIQGIAASALKQGEFQSDSSGFVTAAPSKVGTKGSEFVGTVAFVWSPAADFAALEQVKLIALSVAAAAFLFLTALSAFALRQMMGVPLTKVSESIAEIATGDYEAPPVYLHRGDEIGRIGRHIEELKEQLKIGLDAENARHEEQKQQEVVVNQLSEGLQSLADGDLTRTLDTPFVANYEALRLNFNETVTKMLGIIGTVVESSVSIQTGLNEISGSSDDLARRTENQAATLEQTAAALKEMTSSVKNAAEGARSVENIVNEAKLEAEDSGKVVQSAVSAMSEIENSARQISQIIGVIDDIAFQTNLLALNAGVEAARAGDAGRGFAVVASEVRILALRSSDAATEIKTLIEDSSRQVDHGVDLVGKAGTALTSIVDRVGHISQLVSEMAAGSAEQSTGLGEINSGVSKLDQVTQQNVAMVEETSAASHVLNTDATNLSAHVAHFKIGKGVRGRAKPTVVSEGQTATSAIPAAHEDDWATAENAPRLVKVAGGASDSWQDF